MRNLTTRGGLTLAASLLLIGSLTACGQSNDTTTSSADVKAETVTYTNCGKEKTFTGSNPKLFVNDGNIISIVLAAGARDNIVAVSSLQRDEDVLRAKYGKLVDGFKVAAPKYPTMENVLAAKPDMMVAGWSYGYSKEKNLTPDTLAEKNIESYTLSESCRSGDGEKRGTMDPWKAVVTDINNIGAITGKTDVAKKAVADIESRKAALEKAPKADKTPVAFLFDSGAEDIFSSGSYGAPEAILSTAGAKNALTDVKDTWTKVSWERLATANPDIIFFVDYPPQTFAQKVQALEANPASKNLTAVKEKRFVNLPYAMWTSGPLNIDAAEIVRKSLEHFELQPKSDIKAGLDITSLKTPGNDWAVK